MLSVLYFAGAPFVSISLSQRSPVPWMNWVGNVHHGLPPDLFSLSTAPRGYLAFLGRVAPEKGLHVAITLALPFIVVAVVVMVRQALKRPAA